MFGAILDRERRAASGSARPTSRCPRRAATCPGSLMLETTWQTRTGWLIVRDALVMGPWHHVDERSSTHRRSPDRLRRRALPAAHGALRVSGTVDLAMSCEPVFDYGRRRRRTGSTTAPGYGEAVARPARASTWTLRLTTDLRLRLRGRAGAGADPHGRGRRRPSSRSRWSPHPAAARPSTRPTSGCDRTADHWQHWITAGKFPDHPWRSYLQRSALTLKGLTYAPTGALLAAATTSLPETPRRRTQLGLPLRLDPRLDLRAVGALHPRVRLGGRRLLLLHRRRACRRRSATCRSCTASAASATSTEATLDHLHGYDGAPPGADRQRRLRPAAARRLGRGARLGLPARHVARAASSEALWPVLKRQVEEAAEHWREPDRGIWEVRGEPQALHVDQADVLGRAGPRRRWPACTRSRSTPGKWQALADEIHADICANGVDERGVFTQHYGTDALDASLLLMPLVRFLPPDDPRIRATVLAIADELTEDGLVLRYRTEETDDGLARRGGHASPSARSGWCRRSSRSARSARPASCASGCCPSPARSALRRGDRPEDRPAPRQLPPGVHPPRPDQRGRARDPRRGARRRALLHPGPLRAGLTRPDQGRTTPAARRPRPLACTPCSRTNPARRSSARPTPCASRRMPSSWSSRGRSWRRGGPAAGGPMPVGHSAGADRGHRARAPSRRRDAPDRS